MANKPALSIVDQIALLKTRRQYCRAELAQRYGESNAKEILDLNAEVGMSIDVAKVISGKPETKRVLDETTQKQRWMYELYDWKGYKTNVSWKGYDFENGKQIFIKRTG